MKTFVKWATAVIFIATAALTAFAQDVTENAGPVKINWSKKKMVFTGDGAPNLNAPNAASARLGAERAAYMDALRKALEALKGIKIRAGQTVGQKMSANPGIAGEVEGVLRGFKAVDKRYYSDGGVQIDLEVPLDGAILGAIMKDEIKQAPVKKAEPAPVKKEEPKPPVIVKKEEPKPEPKPEAKPEPKAEVKKVNDATGLVVMANELRVIPVLAPRILDETGKDVYDVTMVSDAGIDNGIVSYEKQEKDAVTHRKIGEKPLVVKAVSTPNSVDLVVSNGDAQTIRDLSRKRPFLEEGRVIIVKK